MGENQPSGKETKVLIECAYFEPESIIENQLNIT